MAAEVVASLLARDPEQAREQAGRAAAAGADWIELRLDAWPAGADLRPVVAALDRPVLVACRLPRDGGVFAGTAAERRALLAGAVAAGARALDLEDWEHWAPPERPERLVRSVHFLDGVPGDLAGIRDRLLGRGDLAKLVVSPRDLAGAAPLMALLASTDQRRAPTVAFAMGAAAQATRVVAGLLGSPWIYGSVDGEPETAPGQLPVEHLVELYRAHRLGGGTALFGLLGDPALASLGPRLHNRAFARLGIDAVYVPLETARPEEVVAMLPADRLRGLSVTAPHKERMVAACDELDAAAEACGSVNTLIFESGRVIGHNTDVIGVRAPLLRAGVPENARGAPAAVLGTGGAARAAAWALATLGFEVTVLGRRPEAMARWTEARGLRRAPLEASVLRSLEPQVVVQATPAGGEGRSDADTGPLSDWCPPASATVLDMVYRPEVTALLRRATAAGAVTVSGVEMFLAQAAAQLEWFVGRTLPEAELRECLVP